MRLLLLLFVPVCFLAGGVLSPEITKSDPYAPTLAPWNRQFYGRAYGERPGLLIDAGNRALAAGGVKSAEEAMDYFDGAFLAATRTGDRARMADSALKLARLCFKRVNVEDRGADINKRITSYFETMGAGEVVLTLRIRLGDLLRDKADLAQAEALYDEAAGVAGRSERRAEVARDYFELARDFFVIGDFAGALRSKHKGEKLGLDALEWIGLDAASAALDEKILEAAAQRLSEKSKAGPLEERSPARPAGAGSTAPAGGVGKMGGANGEPGRPRAQAYARKRND
jgi:tetratricopeptide (TPR) repeat protein